MKKKRDDLIDYLIRREFPGTNAPPPPPSLGEITSALSGIHDGEASKQWEQQRHAQAERRAELSRMPDAEFHALAERTQAQERERDRLRREQQTPAAKEPDADFWTREDEWALVDSALLLTNLEPRSGLGLHLMKMLKGQFDVHGFTRESETPRGLSDDAQRRLNTAQEIIRRATVAGRNGNLLFIVPNATVEPRRLLIWARDKGYPPPPIFASLIADVPSRPELEQEVQRLRAELAQVWKFDDAGPHYPPELDIATLAWRAVSNEKTAGSESVRRRLVNWIKKGWPALKPEQIKRIATVANWDKQSGRKPKQNK